ncbi:MAG: hypothetical protein ACRDY5_04075, partial [Acidimicrobiales bacterium]
MSTARDTPAAPTPPRRFAPGSDDATASEMTASEMTASEPTTRVAVTPSSASACLVAAGTSWRLANSTG